MRLFVITVVLLIFAANGRNGPAHYNGVGRTLTTAEIKYQLMVNVGQPLWCRPLALRAVGPGPIHEQVVAIRANDPEAYAAIVTRMRVDPNYLTEANEREVLTQFDLLSHVSVSPREPGYAFDYLAGRYKESVRVTGTIDATGGIALEHADRLNLNCPFGEVTS